MNARLRSARVWIRERVPLDREALRLHVQERLPVYMKEWFWALGGTPLILLVFMVLSGLLLTLHYVPHPMHAHRSIVDLSQGVRYGWLVRGIHATSSNLLLVTVLLHLTRVYFMRAYRRPRELTWATGVLLLLTVLALAFTGYSLVYDQVAYWATTVGTSLLGSLPGLGEPILWALRGGTAVNPDTLLRFYSLHVSALPAVLGVLLVGHITLVRLHGVSVPEGERRAKTYPLAPDHLIRELLIAVLLLTGIVCWTVLFPPVVGPAADPTNTPAGIRPEWYFYPTFRWLKLVPLQVGLWSTSAFFLAMLAWPAMERVLDKLGMRVHRALRLGFLSGCLAYFTMLVLLIVETAVE